MRLVENEKKNTISTMLSIIKIAIIVFTSISIYINMQPYWYSLNIKKNGELNIYPSVFILCIIALAGVTMMITNINLEQSANIFKLSWLLESIVFIIIISLPIYLFAAYQSECKYIFLLLIISSTIQYGSRYGISTSIAISFSILSADLLYTPIIDGSSIYFQRDLIMSFIFIFVAWILGYYVDAVAENNKQKDRKLTILNLELEEQNKQRENIEVLLLKNNICYDMLFENSISAIIVHENGKIIYTNNSAARLLGYENPTQLNDKSIYNYYSQENIASAKGNFVNITNNKLSKVIGEEIILNSCGCPISVCNTSSFFIYNGKSSVLTLLLDITSEKQIQILRNDVEKNLRLLNISREFNTLITEFFINMSHEFKTPVNVIFTAIQTMNIYLENFNNNDIDKLKLYLKIMKQNCFRMIRLINNLMDITKVDSGVIKINKINDNIVSVVEDITQSVATYVKSKDIELIFDTNVEEKIMAFDPDKIERVILNLLSNAFKYTDSSGHIYINLEDKGEEVTITVKDDGQGIPQNMLNIIFERFGQVNRTLSRQCEGTGIGLYLVKSFIDMHGGKISVISEEGKGSEFSIVLPVGLVDSGNDEYKDFCKTNVERINIEFSDVYSISI